MSRTFTLRRRWLPILPLVVLCLAYPVAGDASPDESTLLARVQSPDAPLHDKATALEELALRGGPASVAALAELLDDEQLSHYVRYALQTNPAPEAGAALRTALDQTQGEHLIGVINSVASRHDPQAVDALAKLLKSEDQAVAIAAAGALATIRTDATLAALEAAPQDRTAAFADALLQAALVHEQRGERGQAAALLKRLAGAQTPASVKQAATLALLRVVNPNQASAMMADLLSSTVDWEFVVGLQASALAGESRYARELSAALPRLSPDRQARVLAVLAAKREGVSLAAVRAAGGSPHAEVRAAAATALGALGNSTDGPLLVGMALDDAESHAAAIEALVRIKDAALNEYLIGMLRGSETSEQVLAAEVIGRRQADNAMPVLLEQANDAQSAEVRLAALGALRRMAPGTALGQILDLAKDARHADEKQLARQATIEIARRSADRAAAVAAVAQRFESWPPEQRGMLLDVLARVGTREALQLVAQAAEAPDRVTQNEATRVLGSWPSADAAPILLKLAGADHPFAVRSLRGYLRIARQYKAGDARLAMCRRALEVAKRDDERMLSLQILALTPTPASLRLAATQLSPDALGARAGDIVVAMAEAVAATDPDAAAEAAAAVLEAGGSDELLARARQLTESR